MLYLDVRNYLSYFLIIIIEIILSTSNQDTYLKHKTLEFLFINKMNTSIT